ncbi:MAG: T9SS type A sorting domain-containing protein, partial [Bacteroidota bacterium]
RDSHRPRGGVRARRAEREHVRKRRAALVRDWLADHEVGARLEAFVDVTEAGADLVIGQPVSDEGGPALPDVLALGPPSPNPASGPVAVSVSLPEAGPVRVAVYDALGREVAVALDRELPAGAHTVRLGGGLAPGVYVVRLGAGTEEASRVLTVVR